MHFLIPMILHLKHQLYLVSNDEQICTDQPIEVNFQDKNLRLAIKLYQDYNVIIRAVIRGGILASLKFGGSQNGTKRKITI